MSGLAWPACYEIRVDGVLDVRWADWFGGLRVENNGSQTVIVGVLADQPALHGVLAQTLRFRRPPNGLGRLPRSGSRVSHG